MAAQTFLEDAEISLNQDEIQGDVLVGLQKKAEIFIFFRVESVRSFKAGLARLAPEIATVRLTKDYEEATPGTQAKSVFEKVNVAFSCDGLELLGMYPDGVPADVDTSFRAGARASAERLGDDVAGDWHPEYRTDTFHGVFLVAAWDSQPRRALTLARARAEHVKALFGEEAMIEAHREECMVREAVIDGVPQSGHEHFGFADGVSQPGVEGLTKPSAAEDQGFPGQDIVKAGDFVLGSAYEREDGKPNAPSLSWMENGSYLVLRRLVQDVEAFRSYVAGSWTGLADSEDQFAARLIGRWKDGSPLELSPAQPDSALDEHHPEKTNDFQFGPDPDKPDQAGGDADQSKCPFAAHIRRVYPRDDLPDEASEKRRIIRAGIAFGDDGEADKGLLFICYQSSIVDKFEFIQQFWANSATFPHGAVQPGMNVPPRPGIDVVIGQGAEQPTQTWETGDLKPFPKFVRSTGAGYFFSPSVSALKQIASAG